MEIRATTEDGMEGLVVSALLYICFAVIVYGAVLSFPTRPHSVRRHWDGVVPGDTVVVRGEEREVVEVDLEHDAVRVDRAFEHTPLPGEWVIVRHHAPV
jgi:hypothetical protein